MNNLIAHRERNKAKGYGFGEVFHQGDKKMAALKIGGSGVDDLVVDAICVAMRGRDPENPSNRTTGAPTEQRLEPCSTEGKTNCLTTVSKDNLIMQVQQKEKAVLPYDDYNSKFPKDLNKVGAVRQTFASLAIRNGFKIIELKENEPRIRRLTPTECARLQTIPEWYKWQCSETQQYKMLGNGWTVEVIKHIFSYLN